MEKLSPAEWFGSIESLLFPTICGSCSEALNSEEEIICISCLSKLPRTNYHRLDDNPVVRKLLSRIPVSKASAFLYFKTGNLAQLLLHKLKYEGRQDVGEWLGGLFGKDLISDGFPVPDVIIPLPLHPAKKKLRGFNQSDAICRGLAKYLGAPVSYDSVIRIAANSTQTKKGRFERWLNVEHIFEAGNREMLLDKKVLLVDDVITTGSTLEACGKVILNAGAAELNIATLASA
jgi:ComF family protein